MTYTPPQDVLSPQSNIVSVNVVFDGLADSWCVAEIMWREDAQSEPRGRVGIRWNGTDEHAMGNPQSTARPTWFMLPENLIAEAVLAYARESAKPPTQ
jgi:hypothetical protein